MNEVAAIEAPLGVTLTASGVDVAVYSARGTAVDVCLFDETGSRESARARLMRGEDGVHRGSIAGVRIGARYGLRVEGPFDPLRGDRFDASKLLADPYAFEFDRPFRLHPSMFALGVDSGAYAPKAIVGAPAPGQPGRLRVPWDETIIYEANLRGLTQLREDVPEAARGTFAGLAHPAIIAHLRGLGVTTVEIMPADIFVDERHLPPLGLSNAWGYNPVVLGAPDPRLAPGGWAEVRAATDALHAAGLEAVLDIVLNHNGESDEFGPTISLRGLDNASYFRLLPNDPARYVNDMGCGNCLALDRPPVVAMALAALRRWMILGGFDGFRFDLAVAIGRRDWGFDAQAPLFQAIAADPVLSQAKLIAEPWDIGPDGYKLGAFPESWGEWNDKFRDSARRFWRGDAHQRGELATRLAGSRDVFSRAHSPTKSVNYVVAHDGFTLADLVAYDRKHNEANGEHNRDGSDGNFSWNHGEEGPSDDPAIVAARARDVRNLMALLFVARGTPMLGMGAELGLSQNGNNNAYAQDNATTWIDWSKADAGLIAFVSRLAAIRRDHPALSREAWPSGAPIGEGGAPDIEWRDGRTALTTAAQWETGDDAALMAVFAARGNGGVDRVAVAFNRGDGFLLRLPEARVGKAWRILIDSNDDAVADLTTPLADRVRIAARATLILAEVDAPNPRLRAPSGRDVDSLAEAAGIAGDWWDVSGKRAVVSPETKLALLAAIGLPAATQGQARESLGRLVEETSARRLPYVHVSRLDGPRLVPLRSAPEQPEHSIAATVLIEDGRTIDFGAEPGDAESSGLADGRTIIERMIALPELPVGRHRLFVDGVECALVIAPSEAHVPKAAQRRRFGVAAQLYALRREGDQGIGDFSTLARAGALAGEVGAGFVGLSPLHALYPSNRERASPYHPSDRRFLEAQYIDALDDFGLPQDEICRVALAAEGDAIRAARAEQSVDYPAVWAIKRRALGARYAAFARARAAQPGDPIFADYDRFVAAGGEALQRFAIFEAIAARRGGEDWRRWDAPLRDGERAALDHVAGEESDAVASILFAQWLADRQLAAAAARAKQSGLDIGFYRDLAVGAAPDGAESWARRAELALAASVGAPPDPFSAQGQVWNVPPPNPLAAAREGFRGFSTLIAANMRHAGVLRIDHAMGLARLFVIPDGARPAEGAYLAYPVDDLLGIVSLESQRAQCMVVGEDLGTVPQGFSDKLRRSEILGTRVLWFERRGADFVPPNEYTGLAVACVSTHDLPTFVGWWSGADIAERLELGLIPLEDAERIIAERLNEKHALVAALTGRGLIDAPPDFAAPPSDALAAAAHAFLASASSLLVSAQLDDLAGERLATNLPGTDRERPNWRHKLPLDIDALFASPRAKAILTAMAEGRK
jgi:glycogen debranching enzyme GlgX/4-alpha-glucanotransferase